MDLIVFPALFFIIFIFFLFKFVKFGSHSPHHQKLPPGPWKLPLIGSLLHMAAGGPLPHRTLKDLSAKHGPLMHLQLGEISAIVVSSPRVAKQLMKTHDLALSNKYTVTAIEIFAYNGKDIAFAPYGDYWRQIRKIATLELLSSKKVRSFRSIREEEVQNLVESINSSLSSGSISPVLDLTENIFSLISGIAGRSTFGNRPKDQDYLIKIMNEVISLAGGFTVADLFPSFKFLHAICGMRPKLEKLHQKVDRILDTIVNEHVEEKGINSGRGSTGDHTEDLLDVLIRLKDSDSLEFPITHDNIKAVILDVFSGGSDTSSTAIEWAMAEMIRNPRVMEKTQAELRQALKGKQVIDESDIKELGYLKLVIKETLRLHPPVALIPRECREECEIDGYTIPVGTKVIINAWAIGRDPEYWNDAESFYPERFENSGVDFWGNNYEFLPFGSGRRMCAGIAFALASVELIIAQLLYHFNWKLPNGMKPEDLDMSESFGSSVKRRNNLYLIPTRPSNS